MSKKRKDIWNLPNILTMFRIVLVPVVCVALWLGSPRSCYLAAWCLGIASATDYFDGYLARKKGLVSKTGKFLDPLADKLLVMSCLVMLVSLGRIPAWIVIVILAREFTITGLRAIAAGDGKIIAAGRAGKWKTAFQLTGLVGLLIHYQYEVNFVLFTGMVNFGRVGLWLLCLSVFFSVTSAIEYFRGYKKALQILNAESTS